MLSGPPFFFVFVFVQEYLGGEGGDDARHEMAQHFELCDSDGDGFITFSQFLRWVELCGLDPDDHLQVLREGGVASET